MKHFLNQRFLFFSPPEGSEGLSSSGEAVSQKINEISLALNKANDLLSGGMRASQKAALEYAKSTITELRNNINAGSFTAEQNEQLEYAINTINQLENEIAEKNKDPNTAAEKTKSEANNSIQNAQYYDNLLTQLEESDRQFMEDLRKVTKKSHEEEPSA